MPEDKIPEEDKPDISPQDIPGLGQRENEEGKFGTGKSLYNPLGDDAKSPLSSKGLSSAESSTGLPGESLGRGFAKKAVASGGIGGRVGAFLSQNRKKSIGAGGIMGLVVLILVVGFGFIASYELTTIAKDLIRYEAKAEQKIEKKGSQSVFKDMLCHAIGSKVPIHFKSGAGCNSKTAPEEDETEAEDSEPLAIEIDNFDFKDPNIQSALKAQEIKPNFDSKGDFTGLTDTDTGKVITVNDIGNDTNGIFDRITTALPEWNVGQLTTFRPTLEEDADASLDVLPDETTDNAKMEVEDTVEHGASNSDLTQELGEEDDSQNAKTEAKQATTEAEGEASVDDGIFQTAEAGIKDGESESTILNKVVAKFKTSAKSFLITTAINNVCSLKKDADTASENRKPTIMRLLIRHATTLISIASQLQAGKVTGNEMNGVMSLLNGDSSQPEYNSATAVENHDLPLKNEAAEPFDDSAAWQRIEGNSVNTNPSSPYYTPDIDKSSLPTANSGTYVVSGIDSAFGATGLTSFCSAESGVFGFVFGGLLTAFQFISDGVSFGAAQVGYLGAGVGLQVLEDDTIIPDIVKYFTPVGLDGNEDSVQWMNNADAGSNISYNLLAQRIGGEPESEGQANTQYAEANQSELASEQRESWTDKTFSFSNPDSLFSRLAIDLPTSSNHLLADVSIYFTSIPRDISDIFSTIISPKISADTSTTNPGTPYDLTQYGFSDSDVDKYDAVQNEQFLYNNTVTYGGKTDSLIDLLGNPTNFPNGEQDSSTDDVFHCFTQGFQSSVNDNSSTNDPICASEGSFDYDYDTPPQKNVDPETISPNNAIITDFNVANSFCEQLAPGFIPSTTNSPSPLDTNPTTAICNAAVLSQLAKLGNVIGHFRQYILDTYVMNNFTSLTNNQ